jgi:hypothetical protein
MNAPVLIHAFNPMQHDPSQGSGSLPIGKHPVIIESAEVKATQDNTSGYLQLNLKVIDGQHAGATGPYRLNLYNQSQKAAEIAHKQLSAICHAVRVFQLGPDGTQVQYLFNQPFIIEVGYQRGEEPGPNNPDAKGYTEVKRVFDAQGNEPGKQGAAQGQQQGGFGGQQQQQQNNGQQFQQAPQVQQQNPQGGQAWGGQQGGQQAPQQGQQSAPANAWGNGPGQPQAQQEQAPQQQQQGGPAWGAQGAPTGTPAWGQQR